MATSSSGSTKWLHGRKWYYRLIPNSESNARPLFRDYSHAELRSQLVVRLSSLDKDGAEWRYYTVFDSYIQYLDFIHGLPEPKRSCFEILTGRQKPHFDLDLDLSEVVDGEEVMLELRDLIIDAFIQMVPGMSLEKDLLFFTSHGPKKRSLHIVLNNWYHNDNKEAREFYRQVTEYIHNATSGKYGEGLYRLVDRNVYGENQNFRIVGTHKLGTTRTKILVPRFTYKGIVYNHQFSYGDMSQMTMDQIERKKSLTILRESLVSFTADSTWLPIVIPVQTAIDCQYADLTEGEVEQAMKLVSTYDWEQDRQSSYEWDQELFRVSKVEGNRIVLLRIRPSYCPLCKRYHHGQNPWIKIYEGRCYWHCRQFPGRTSIRLGQIDGDASGGETEEVVDLFEPILTIGGQTVSTGFSPQTTTPTASSSRPDSNSSSSTNSRPESPEPNSSRSTPGDPTTSTPTEIGQPILAEDQDNEDCPPFVPFSMAKLTGSAPKIGILSQKPPPEVKINQRKLVIPPEDKNKKHRTLYVPKSQIRLAVGVHNSKS